MNNKWKAFFTGDVVITKEPPRDFISKDLTQVLAEHDVISCNFEAPVYVPSARAIPKAFSPAICQHPKAANRLQEMWFNVINLGNNHMYDYGQEALEATLNAFSRQITVGAGPDFDSAYKLKTINIKGVEVGFLSFCEAEFGALTDENTKNGGYAWINHPSVNDRIKNARELVDVLFIQAHAGPEKTDLPLPEWRQRYREFIDSGADAVIGHHPHVPQGWEFYRGKPIFYSLGNFYFDVEINHPLWNRGYAVSLSFSGSKFEEVEVIPVEKTSSGVDICKNQFFAKHLDYLREILDDEVYMDLVNRQAVQLWENRYYNFYLQALYPFPDRGLWKIAKKVVWKLLKKNDFIDRLSLLHNIRIESHRFGTERALSILEEKNFRKKERPLSLLKSYPQ